MILGYGNYSLSFAISSNGAGDAAFLTSSGNMNDGRIGLVCSMRWSSGSQTTSNYVDITVTVSDPLDATAAIGCVGVANVTGLPAGLKLTVNAVDQVLVQNALGELQAWWLPQTTGNSFTIRIHNDNGTKHPVAASAVFGIGEIFVGRAIQLPALVQSGSTPTAGLQDPTAFQRTDSGSLYQCMRKPWDTYQATFGYFTTSQAYGGSSSNIQSGGNPAGVIDIRRLRGILSTSTLCALCDYPSASFGAGTVSGGLRYDQTFMQPNFIIARPSDPGAITMDQPPLSSWSPTFAKTA